MDKETLRHKTQIMRRQRPIDFPALETIHHNLLQWLDQHSFPLVLAYFPMKYELSLLSLYHHLSQKGVSLYFPRISTQDNCRMDFFYVSPEQWPISPTSYIWEPTTSSAVFSSPYEHYPIFVPSLLLDPDGYRLGFGGGYYDRFFLRFPHLLRVAPQFSCYCSPHALPRDTWDIPIQMAITEQGIRNFGK